ncbi:MAG: hypothetical protein K5857_10830, partial [Lachnospiraceae bacterium]|nr:hypothetical protein [Lachnospiraceae bacterium]
DMQSRTDAPVSPELVFGENFLNTQEFRDMYSTTGNTAYIIFKWVTSMLAYAPLIYLLWKLCKKAIDRSDKRLKKLCFFGLFTCTLVSIYSWTSHVLDQGRYMILCFMALFFGIFVLIRKKDTVMLESIALVDEEFTSKIGHLWPAYIIAYLACVGTLAESGAIGMTFRLQILAQKLMDAVGFYGITY